MLVVTVTSVGALVVGFQIGKIMQADDDLTVLPLNNQSQVISNQQSAENPDDAFGVYTRNCASCHGAVGEGSAIAPPLNSPDLRARLGDTEISEIIELGRPGTAMPPWTNRLTDAEIATLTQLIRDWGDLDNEQLSNLETQGSYGNGRGNCLRNHSMMGSGCGSGMGGHMWRRP